MFARETRKHPWDERTCTSAAKSDNLSCLIYALEHECKYNKKQLLKESKGRRGNYIISIACTLSSRNETKPISGCIIS